MQNKAKTSTHRYQVIYLFKRSKNFNYIKGKKMITVYQNKQEKHILIAFFKFSMNGTISAGKLKEGNSELKSYNYQIKLIIQYLLASISASCQMALRRLQPTQTILPQGLSKREQRKLEQTLRLFPAFDPKPIKKRKTIGKEIRIMPLSEEDLEQKETLQRQDEAENLAETKQQSQFNSTLNSQASNETSKSPLNDESFKKEGEPRKKECFLNEKYFIKEQFSTIFEFLNQYQYRQMEKSFEKECQNYEAVDNMGVPLKIGKNHLGDELMRKMRDLMASYRQSLDKRPFSKAHKTLSASLSKNRK